METVMRSPSSTTVDIVRARRGLNSGGVSNTTIISGGLRNGFTKAKDDVPPVPADNCRQPGGQLEQSHCEEQFEPIPPVTAFWTVLGFVIVAVFSLFHELLRMWGIERAQGAQDSDKHWKFVHLYSDFESFWIRNVYRKAKDCFNRPVASAPGPEFELLDRVSYDNMWTLNLTGEKHNALNLGSYNYLGFAENRGPCIDATAKAIRIWGLPVFRQAEIGVTKLQQKLEKLVADYMGVEAAICFPMGFATNSMNAPCLAGKNSLILSDECNHASLILGCRLSGAEIRVFKHNDMADLERHIRDAIVFGRRRTHRPFDKILIVVEGIYSMEGSICRLPEIIALKRQYRCYLYLDEAHSVGALGTHGRGVVDYWGCNPRDVDVLMGTFTKSFASMGGYIAGKKALIDHLKIHNHISTYASCMSAPAIQQVISTMTIIMGRDGTNVGREKVERLSRNSWYFRRRLRQQGFLVYGNEDSPVVPVLLFEHSKCILFTREVLRRGVGVVIVGVPAVSVMTGRVRFCVSAAHTRHQLDTAIDVISETGDLIGGKHSRRPFMRGDTVEY